MQRSRRRLFIRTIIALGLSAALLPAGRLPGKWDIQIIVEAEGRYGLEDGGERHEGSFALRIHWLGLMERDDEDFLLLHKEYNLEKWEAEERSSRGEALELLKTGDFPAHPELRVNYVIQEGDSIRFDFAVLGFKIPLALSEADSPLILPSSTGNGAGAPGRAYDRNVHGGSNLISIPLAALLKGPEVRKFPWSWNYRGWLPHQGRNLLATQSHDAIVTVSITPHEE
ncbi:MAG: hypothetical protein PHI34_07340 [Acidobacteriota bacterium]|nr:hypothetical protein [Acidobacteriota bacterium]